jgi:PTS system galactitol-specific IIC component
LCYYPYALIVDTIIGKIPKLKNINGRPEHLREKVGFFGDSRFIGLIMGLGIGISAGYNLRDVLELGISVAGVVFILPKMANILGEGLIPISEGVKDFIIQKYPKLKDARMGMDVAVIIGMPEVIVSGILVMPIAVLLSMVLPGVRFTPLGDLPNVIGAGAMIVIATRGNIFRSVIAYIPIVIGKLYAATALAGLYTNIVIASHIDVNNFMGEVTSFQDGGNLFRTFLYYLFTGHSWTYVVLPLVFGLLWFTYRVYKKENIRA